MNRFDETGKKPEEETAKGMTATEANKRKVIAAIRKPNKTDTIRTILGRVEGVAYSTYLRWRKEDDDFKEKIDELWTAVEEMRSDAVEEKLYKTILEDAEMGKVQADLVKTYLKTKGKNRGWTEKIEIKNEGDNGAISIQYIQPNLIDNIEDKPYEIEENEENEE